MFIPWRQHWSVCLKCGRSQHTIVTNCILAYKDILGWVRDFKWRDWFRFCLSPFFFTESFLLDIGTDFYLPCQHSIKWRHFWLWCHHYFLTLFLTYKNVVLCIMTIWMKVELSCSSTKPEKGSRKKCCLFLVNVKWDW